MISKNHENEIMHYLNILYLDYYVGSYVGFES